MIGLTSVSFVLCALQIIATVECRPEVTEKQKVVTFTKIDYEINKDIGSLNVELINHTDSTPTVNLNAELFDDIPDNLFINAIISKRSSETEYHALIKSGRVSLCKHFKNPEKEPFLKLLLDSIESYGRMMFRCPVEKEKYYLKDFRMEASNLPSYTPTGQYKVDFAVTKKEKDTHLPIFRMLWYATISMQ